MDLLTTVPRFVVQVTVASLLLVVGCDRDPVASKEGDWHDDGPGGEFSLLDVWGSSTSDVFAVGARGTILHYDGARWTTMNSGISYDLKAVWGRSAQDVYAVGPAGSVLHYDGTGWFSLSHTPLGNVFDVWTAPEQSVYVSSSSGVWVRDGSQWTLMGGSPAAGALFGFAGRIHPAIPDEKLQLVVLSGRSVILWNNRGWSPGYLVPDVAPIDIWGPSCGQLFLSCTEGWMYNFAGNSSARSRPVMRYLYAVHGQSAENVYAVGSGGKTVHYDGKKWKELPSPVTTTLSGVWTAGSGEVFAVGAEGVILHYNP